jgi:hypothetical protein
MQKVPLDGNIRPGRELWPKKVFGAIWRVRRVAPADCQSWRGDTTALTYLSCSRRGRDASDCLYGTARRASQRGRRHRGRGTWLMRLLRGHASLTPVFRWTCGVTRGIFFGLRPPVVGSGGVCFKSRGDGRSRSLAPASSPHGQVSKRPTIFSARVCRER